MKNVSYFVIIFIEIIVFINTKLKQRVKPSLFITLKLLRLLNDSIFVSTMWLNVILQNRMFTQSTVLYEIEIIWKRVKRHFSR